ncbi:hypothetical protein COCON_G00144970 [Conger conger]|uniref:Guanine nucleotide-binding protein-like 3 n=1 Tax=Conger conger TaxID=82655 RepID=A0A9Q1HWA5_CONCO|nr:hypothetical protein COCON_G00144970 [Conger conger]
MKRPKLKKASKRLSCSKRYKIQKKVREHNRKLRKEAKKKGITKRVKKDPGVPSTAPFKEEVLREAEQRKLKLEELKQKKKLEKQQERAQKRKRESTSSDSNTKAKKAKKERSPNHPKSTGSEKYSRKFLCDELNKVISASDVIVEVLDARDPLGCRCPELEEAVLKSEGNKKLLLVLNKIDLVQKSIVEKWLRYLQREFPAIAFKSSVYLQDKTVQEKKKRAVEGAVEQSKGVDAFGSSCLLQFLQDYAEAQESENALKVGIVGFPNVGKSSLINSLKGIRACHAGVQQGLTKCTQEVHVAKNVKMFDSPSIMAAPSNPAFTLALRSLPTPEKGGNALDAARALLKLCDKQQIMLQYTVPDFRNSLEFLTHLAKKRGFIQKGGIPNTEQAAEVFLSNWTGTKLSYHSKPPDNPSLPSYLSDEAVTEMKKGWDLSKLQQGNAETIKSVKFRNSSSTVVLSSTRPTSGLLSVSEGLVTKELMDEEECQEEAFDNEPDFVHAEQPQQEQTQNGKEPQETRPSSAGNSTKVTFQPMPITIDLSSAQREDDAYDFNTDFK